MYQDWIETYDEAVSKHKKNKEITIDKKLVDNIITELKVEKALHQANNEMLQKEKQKVYDLEDELIMIYKNIEDILRNRGALGRIPKEIIERHN